MKKYQELYTGTNKVAILDTPAENGLSIFEKAQQD